MLLLWRWSTAIQFASVTMIAAFFIVLARSNPRAEVRWWAWAWAANVSALVSTLVFWYFQPSLRLASGPYLASKSAFVLLFLIGVAFLALLALLVRAPGGGLTWLALGPRPCFSPPAPLSTWWPSGCSRSAR